jgi:hypothetical protein
MMKSNTHAWLILFVVVFIIGNIGYPDSVRQDTITRYYSISPTAFGPENENQDFTKNHDYIYSDASGDMFYAPVYLPDSAVVVEFTTWLWDDAPTDMIAHLACTPHGGGHMFMASITSSGATGMQELTDTTIEHSVIDNATYKYSVDFDTYAIGTSHILYSMIIKYIVIQESPAVEETQEETMSESVEMIYPTPFSHYTSIKYHVPKQENVSIKVYDEMGRLVRTLVDDMMFEGSYTARWDGLDFNGNKVSNGSYFCVIKTNGSRSTKVVHIK